MKKVAIYGQASKFEAFDFVENLIHHLSIRDTEICIEKNFKELLATQIPKAKSLCSYDADSGLDNDIDLLFSLGGDGTILRALTYIKQQTIPVFGINTGRLGFLATTQKEAMESAIEQLYNKAYEIEERTMIYISEHNHKNPNHINFNIALNEITISKKSSTSMIGVEAYLDDEYLTTYWADGLIIATPTGSTGYSLSCQGPIVLPKSNNFVLTPIAPHNLNARPIVIPDNTAIKMVIQSRNQDFFIALDSRVFTFEDNTEILIRKAKTKAQLVKLKDDSFIKTLRSKLLWGEDKRNHNN